MSHSRSHREETASCLPLGSMYCTQLSMQHRSQSLDGIAEKSNGCAPHRVAEVLEMSEWLTPFRIPHLRGDLSESPCSCRPPTLVQCSIYDIATQAHLELCPGSIDVRSVSMLQDVSRKKRRSSISSAGSHRIPQIQRISAMNTLNSKT